MYDAKQAAGTDGFQKYKLKLYSLFTNYFVKIKVVKAMKIILSLKNKNFVYPELASRKDAKMVT